MPTYLSDRFSQQDFAHMNSNNIYAFYSMPGSGKTTLISQVLQPYLQATRQQALYLSHRTIINQQNQQAFDNTIIHVKTYQKLEHDLKDNRSFFQDYAFIICDECHYFVADAFLNSRTNLSFDFVNQSKAVIILLSGTPEYLQGIKKQWSRPVKVLAGIDSQQHNLNKICLASANKDEQSLLKNHLAKLTQEGKRIIVYDSNIERLHQLYQEYEQHQTKLNIQVTFLCSSHNKKYALYNDKETLDSLTTSQKADCNLLFITSAINSGVSIDDDFDYLFIFGTPTQTDIFQLIARVRPGTKQRRLEVYCTVPKYGSLKAKLHSLESELAYLDDPVEWYKKNPANKLPRFIQLPHNYIYDQQGRQSFDQQGRPLTDCQRLINPMALAKTKHDIKEYTTTLRQGNPLQAYTKLFHQRYKDLNITFFSQELQKECACQLKTKIEILSHTDLLFKESQKQLKSICLEYGQPTGLTKINNLLSKYNSRLLIVSCQKKIKGQKMQVWQIQRY